jgi:hypothetical protein
MKTIETPDQGGDHLPGGGDVRRRDPLHPGGGRVQARFPHSVWARKKQAEENLAHLAPAVANALGSSTSGEDGPGLAAGRPLR